MSFVERICVLYVLFCWIPGSIPLSPRRPSFISDTSSKNSFRSVSVTALYSASSSNGQHLPDEKDNDPLSPLAPMNTGSLRRRLMHGGKSYGPVCMSDSPIVIELLAMAGYGHMIIDHEHAPTGIESGQRLLQAMDAATSFTSIRTEPIVRLPAHDPVYMKKVLDSMRLPGGVLVPMVEDAETARQVVRSTRYPNQQQRQQKQGDDDSSVQHDSSVTSSAWLYGIRGCAVPFIRASGWGRNSDYVQMCQDDLLVMVQVETQQGVDAIPDIAAVDGVDAIFLGPFDLSCSVGKMGQFDDAQVTALIRNAERAVLESPSNCLLAGFRSPNRSLKEMYDSGYSLVCGSVDLGLLREAARHDVEAANQAMR
jgi:2-keto-3-deoxy-L-rhamnonate aldolase RhmA